MPIVSEVEIRGKGSKRPRLYGHLITLDTGVKLYLARRRHREIFRSGKSTISGAMAEDVACWAIDEQLLVGLRAKGVQFIGVNVIDTGDRYLTRIGVFFDRKIAKTHDYTGVGRGGSRQRLVPLTQFTVRKAVATLDASLYESD